MIHYFALSSQEPQKRHFTLFFRGGNGLWGNCNVSELSPKVRAVLELELGFLPPNPRQKSPLSQTPRTSQMKDPWRAKHLNLLFCVQIEKLRYRRHMAFLQSHKAATGSPGPTVLLATLRSREAYSWWHAGTQRRLRPGATLNSSSVADLWNRAHTPFCALVFPSVRRGLVLMCRSPKIIQL